MSTYQLPRATKEREDSRKNIESINKKKIPDELQVAGGWPMPSLHQRTTLYYGARLILNPYTTILMNYNTDFLLRKYGDKISILLQILKQ